jgi:hypothetical protein
MTEGRSLSGLLVLSGMPTDQERKKTRKEKKRKEKQKTSKR